MEKLAISKFKATCLAVIEEVKRSGEPVLITRRGEPMAELVPARPPAKSRSILGAWVGKGKILGDLIEPASDEEDWEVLRD